MLGLPKFTLTTFNTLTLYVFFLCGHLSRVSANRQIKQFRAVFAGKIRQGLDMRRSDRRRATGDRRHATRRAAGGRQHVKRLRMEINRKQDDSLE